MNKYEKSTIIKIHKSLSENKIWLMYLKNILQTLTVKIYCFKYVI